MASASGRPPQQWLPSPGPQRAGSNNGGWRPGVGHRRPLSEVAGSTAGCRHPTAIDWDILRPHCIMLWLNLCLTGITHPPKMPASGAPSQFTRLYLHCPAGLSDPVRDALTHMIHRAPLSLVLLTVNPHRRRWSEAYPPASDLARKEQRQQLI